jgi:hypothetical protein
MITLDTIKEYEGRLREPLGKLWQYQRRIDDGGRAEGTMVGTRAKTWQKHVGIDHNNKEKMMK